MKPPVRISLSDFIKTTMGSQFVIPVYQRNYTWKANQEVKQYLLDLTQVLKPTLMRLDVTDYVVDEI